MSSAKRTLRQAITFWLRGEGPAPRVLRHCDACGMEAWRPLPRSTRGVAVNARLPDGRRADLVCVDGAGRVRLVIQLAGRSRLRDRSEGGAGAPVVTIDGHAAFEDPLRLRPVRERGMPKWDCRCSQARALPVDDAFSLRVIGCPLVARRAGAGAPASVVHDCARCACFVGIGYSDPDRRRVSLYCSFGAAPRPRFGPLPVLRAPAAPAQPLPLAASS